MRTTERRNSIIKTTYKNSNKVVEKVLRIRQYRRKWMDEFSFFNSTWFKTKTVDVVSLMWFWCYSIAKVLYAIFLKFICIFFFASYLIAFPLLHLVVIADFECIAFIRFAFCMKICLIIMSHIGPLSCCHVQLKMILINIIMCENMQMNIVYAKLNELCWRTNKMQKAITNVSIKTLCTVSV